MNEEKITVLVVEPEQKPYVKEIESSLENLQNEVGGDIQAVYPYTEPVGLIVAESGKMMGMPFNRALRDEKGDIYDFVVGKMLIVGLGEENFTSIPDALIPKFTEIFKTPEQLVQIGMQKYILPAKDETPLYTDTAAYAREHNELPQYRESIQANIACKEAIENAVNSSYHGWSLDTKQALDVVKAQFTPERIRYVLAATVQQKDWDGRISEPNKAWAKTIPVADEENRCRFVVDQCHPGLTDLFVKKFRREEDKKPSLLNKLSKPVPKPSAPTKPKSKGQEL